MQMTHIHCRKIEEAFRQSMLCQLAPTAATGTVDKSLLAAVKTEMALFESQGGGQGALFAVNLQLHNVDTTSFCGERSPPLGVSARKYALASAIA